MRNARLMPVFALLVLLPWRAGAAEVFARPVPSAGPGNTTLLVYDTLAKPFSLVNEVAVITTLLGRFPTRVEARQAEAVTVPDLEQADYIVVAGVADVPPLAGPVREALARTTRPVAYLGWASQLAVPGRGAAPRAQALAQARVQYAGGRWTVALDPFLGPGAVPGDPVAVVTAPEPRRYLAWRDGSKFAFASLPVPGAASLLLSDFLLNFYAVKQTPPARLIYLVQDFHPGSDARSFRRLVDYFAARGDRFAVSVRLQPPSGAVPMPEEQYFDALRYAQAHGGRIVLRPEASAGQVRLLLEANLVPLACELPSGAEPPARPLRGISYGTALGRIEAPGPKGTAQAVSASSVMGGEDRTLVIPLNVDPAAASTTARGIAAEVADLARLRGTVAGVVIPAWFPFQKMRDAVDEARTAGLPGADLAGAPNWIKTDQAIITGRDVRRAFSVPGGSSVERLAFGRNFQRIGPDAADAVVATAIMFDAK